MPTTSAWVPFLGLGHAWFTIITQRTCYISPKPIFIFFENRKKKWNKEFCYGLYPDVSSFAYQPLSDIASQKRTASRFIKKYNCLHTTTVFRSSRVVVTTASPAIRLQCLVCCLNPTNMGIQHFLKNTNAMSISNNIFYFSNCLGLLCSRLWILL